MYTTATGYASKHFIKYCSMPLGYSVALSSPTIEILTSCAPGTNKCFSQSHRYQCDGTVSLISSLFQNRRRPRPYQHRVSDTNTGLPRLIARCSSPVSRGRIYFKIFRILCKPSTNTRAQFPTQNLIRFLRYAIRFTVTATMLDLPAPGENASE